MPKTSMPGGGAGGAVRMDRASRSSWLAAIGMVVAIVALWRPGVSVSSGAGSRLVLNLPEWLAIPVAAAALLMWVAMVTARRRHPDGLERLSRPPTRHSAVGILLSLLVVAGVISVVHRTNPDILTALQDGFGAAWSLPQMSGPTTERDALDVPVLDAGVTMMLLALAVVVAAFALLVIAVSEPWAVIARMFRRRGARPPPPQELAAAISVGMRELELGDDPRRAVIACYRRCEAALAAQRRRRHLSETPREFMRGALAALNLPAHAVRALLAVFERARFSELPVTDGDRSVALDALGEIRSALVRSEDGSRP